MYFIETRQLGLAPESARKDKLQTRSQTNYLYKLVIFLLILLRELIAITCLEHKCKILVTVEARRKTVRQAE